MSDRLFEPMTDLEARLSRELRAASEGALRAFDAAAIAHGVATGHGRTGILGVRGGLLSQRAVRLALVGLLIVAIGVTLVVGGSHLVSEPLPGAIAFTRGGDVMMADADGANAVTVSIGDADVSIEAIRWAPDHRTLAFVRSSDAGDELFIVTPDGRTLGWFGGAETTGIHFSWAPDGQRLAVYSMRTRGWPGRDVVSILGLDAQVLETLPLPDGSYAATWYHGGLSWSPDGRWIAVATCTGCTDTRSTAILLAADGTGLGFLKDGEGTASDPVDAEEGLLAWRRDSQLSTVRSCPGSNSCPDQRGWMIETRSGDGLMYWQVALPAGFAPTGIRWSPDGSRLATTGWMSSATEGHLAVVQPDGTVQVLPGDAIPGPRGLRWAADGRSLLFTVDDEAGSGTSLWSVDPVDGALRRVIEGIGPAFDIAD